jgi:hypothetical protein
MEREEETALVGSIGGGESWRVETMDDDSTTRDVGVITNIN